jgi:hypothetical protein
MGDEAWLKLAGRVVWSQHAYVKWAWDTGFCAEMGAMDVRSEDVRAVRPRKRDNEWWTGRAYESRVSSPETPSWRRDQWRGSMAERAAGVE